MNKKVFLLIFFSYLFFFILIPPFQTPDEPEHYENIYWFSRLKYPYLPKKNSSKPNWFVDDLLQFYKLKDLKKIKNSGLLQKVFYSPIEEKKFQPIVSQIYHPPLYLMVGTIFFKAADILKLNIIARFYFVRLTSTLFYFLTVFTALKILQLFFKNKKTISCLLIFFAINPLMLQVGVGINPDAAVTFFAVSFLYALMKRLPIWQIALISASAILSKLSGIFTVLTFLIVLIYQSGFTKKSIKQFSIFSFLFLALTSPWFILNYLRYGKPIVDNFSINLTYRPKPSSFFPAIIFSLAEFRHTFMHFAGFFAWNSIYPPKWFFHAYTFLFVTLALLGVVKIVKKKLSSNNFIILIYTLSLFIFLFFLGLSHKLNGLPWDIQGRYFLPAFLPLTIFIYYQLERAKILAFFSVFHYLFIILLVLIPKFYFFHSIMLSFFGLA